MEKLFETFTPENFWYWLFGLVIVLFALKNFLEQFDFFNKRLKDKYIKEAGESNKLDDVCRQLSLVRDGQDKLNNEISARFTDVENKISSEMNKKFSEIDSKIISIENKTSILMNSDKENIKQYIANEYTRVMNEGWIDPKSFEILLNKFNYYKQEGGNSFVHEMMDDIKRLPKTPPRSVAQILNDTSEPPDFYE